MKHSYLIHIPDTSEFMMSFVLITKRNRAVIIDGGRPEDMPSLKKVVGKREIAAWILTHPHLDHISGFNEVFASDDPDLRPKEVIYSFPPLSFIEENEPEEAHTLRDFLAVEDKVRPLAHKPVENEEFSIDELRFKVLHAWDDARPDSPRLAGNNASLVVRVQGEKKSVMFLGDIGPETGDSMYADHWQELKSDYVQMAHHGHSGPGAEVYLAIKPQACFWCCRDWLYDEIPVAWEPRLYGTRMQRFWMERLGVKKHYVAMDGLHKVEI